MPIGPELAQGGAPGGVKIAPTDDPQVISERQQRWTDFLKTPEVQAALLQFGVALGQPRAPGQTALGQGLNAVAQGGQAAGRVQEAKQAEAERKAREEARQRQLDIQQAGVDVRREGVDVQRQGLEQQKALKEKELQQQAELKQQEITASNRQAQQKALLEKLKLGLEQTKLRYQQSKDIRQAQVDVVQQARELAATTAEFDDSIDPGLAFERYYRAMAQQLGLPVNEDIVKAVKENPGFLSGADLQLQAPAAQEPAAQAAPAGAEGPSLAGFVQDRLGALREFLAPKAPPAAAAPKPEPQPRVTLQDKYMTNERPEVRKRLAKRIASNITTNVYPTSELEQFLRDMGAFLTTEERAAVQAVINEQKARENANT